MGYDVRMRCHVSFPVSKEKEVEEIFKKMDTGKKYGWTEPGFSEVDTLKEMFYEWRYTITKDETKENWIIEDFEGENLGEDDKLWKNLAPLMNEGYIECSGGDGDVWRWIFKNGKMKEIWPTWENE